MSLTDKISNGLVVVAIQYFIPTTEEVILQTKICVCSSVSLCKVWGMKNETLSKIHTFCCSILMKLEIIIFTKFHEDRTNNVDFLLLANFLMCLIRYEPDFRWNLSSV